MRSRFFSLLGLIHYIAKYTSVAVLVVIAIVAITLFRPKIQELWDAIATGINGL